MYNFWGAIIRCLYIWLFYSLFHLLICWNLLTPLRKAQPKCFWELSMGQRTWNYDFHNSIALSNNQLIGPNHLQLRVFLLILSELGTTEWNLHLHLFQAHKQISLRIEQHHQWIRIWQGQVAGPCLANSRANSSACSSVLPQTQTPHPLQVPIIHKSQLKCRLFSSS